MTDDITKNLSDSEKLDFLINAVSDTNQRLGRLEERADARQYDTRPLWEGVQQQLAEIRAHQQQQDEQLAEIRAHQQQQDKQLAEIRAHQQRHDDEFMRLRLDLRKVEKQMGLIHQDNLELRAELGFLDDRLDTLEKAA